MIITDIDFDEIAVEAAAIRLVGEIVSPTTAAIDRVLKRHYYAAAGIPWYLLVDEETGAMQLNTLVDETYTAHADVPPGTALRLTEPVVATIDPAKLLRSPG